MSRAKVGKCVDNEEDFVEKLYQFHKGYVPMIYVNLFVIVRKVSEKK